MNKQNYTASILVDMSPDKVFENINNVSLWWTDQLTGDSYKTGDEFTVQFGDVHVSTQKVIELIPGKKIAWLVTSSQLNFIQDKEEWNNTAIHFEIAETDGQTQINFTHIGLTPAIECFSSCSKGWDYYFKGSLFKLLKEGKGTPGL